MHRVMIIEDTDLMRESLEETLRRAGYEVAGYPSAVEALEVARREPPDLVVTDLKLPRMSGLEALDELKRIAPETPVIVITAHATVQTAVDAMKRGAYDYITKPFEPAEIEVLVKRALEHRWLVAENEALKAELQRQRPQADLVGAGRAIAAVRERIARAAASDATVLITGESGTGKEVVARAIHQSGVRAARPFLCVNCAALSAGLLESELFGHEKGAFTGADKMRRGRFELADGGTLLLDEVSEIDPSLQAKLLRALQERAFERVGSSQTRRTDVRILATTNRDLELAVKQGRFRQDLFFRLNVVPIHLPPLRERREDLPALVDHFLRRFGGEGAVSRLEMSDEMNRLLAGYDWPGNVRELGNIVERALVLFPSGPIRATDLTGWLRGSLLGEGALPEMPKITLEEMEKAMIRAALARAGGNRQRTAELLGIAERTLRDKIKRWALAPESTSETPSPGRT